MDNQLFSDISNVASTSSRNKGDIVCDGGEASTGSHRYPGASTSEILSLIENRRRTSSEYLTEAQANKILDGEVNTDDIDSVFDDIVSTLQKLLVDISVLERSRVTYDIDSNWDDLNEISPSAINICDRSFGEPTLSSSNPEYRLGTQVGRIFTALTGKATVDARGSSFYAGLSKVYTMEYDNPRIYVDRSELIDHGSKNVEANVRPTGIYSDHISDNTKQFVKKHGYDMNMNLIFLASIHNAHQTIPNLPDRDTKEIHDDVVDLLENRVGRWFGMCIDIRSRLDKEWNDINNASASGLPARDALSELWDITIGGNKNTVTSEQIAKNYKKQSYQKQVSQVFNSLSYQSKDDYSQAEKQLVHNTPIVAYDQGWKLTPYGYLLCLYQLHGGDVLMGKIALDEIQVIRETKVQIPFDKETIRQGFKQFYGTDVPKHF